MPTYLTIKIEKKMRKKLNYPHIPPRLRSEMCILMGQNALDDTILVPSFKLANRIFNC